MYYKNLYKVYSPPQKKKKKNEKKKTNNSEALGINMNINTPNV